MFLLGAFRIERDTRPIALPTRKAESLLAYLALFPEPHPREKLAALLWGDSTDEQARHSLCSALTTLRSKLGDDILLADRETVQLSPDISLWVDAREFQEIRDRRLDMYTCLLCSNSTLSYRRRLLSELTGVENECF